MSLESRIERLEQHVGQAGGLVVVFAEGETPEALEQELAELEAKSPNGLILVVRQREDGDNEH
ncbi:MAG: hypothetical protein ACOYZ7_20435 [Chloroflexota bacterium]